MSYDRKKKQKTAAQRELDAEGARMFGKHVSKEKGRILLGMTLLACAAPMILGARMWHRIPEIVPSGIIGANGQDDSIPRWMVAFGLPGLMCLLDFLAHFQLQSHQRRKLVPPPHVRLVGRWGFPILSVIFCSGMIRQSIGLKPLAPAFVAPCVLGLLLMLLGTQMFDCPRDARLSLRFSFTECDEESWKAVHRFAALCWLTAGLLVIAATMLTDQVALIAAVLAPLSLAAPLAYGFLRNGKKA